MIEWLHLVHVLSAMVWVGGGLTLMLIGIRARSGSDPLVLVTGVWMVFAGAAWNSSQFWVLLGLGLFAVAFLIGAVYLSRVGIQLERTARTEGAGRAEAVSVVNRWLLGYWVVLGVLLVAVWDMVFKPGP